MAVAVFAAMFFVAATASEIVLAHSDRVLRLSATSLYDAGRQQGEWAKQRINEWISGDEMSHRFDLINNNETYATLFAGLKRDNSAAFPHLVEELRGIADGSGVSLDEIWAANLLEELDSLVSRSQTEGKTEGHCSDIFGRGYNGSMALHGHNEDWNVEVKPLWYYVQIDAKEGANFTSCAGLAYPGAIVGWAVAVSCS